ncbi:uncharacterized protein [Diabrotica undecimpunctata]|uniref:uncharacterized protein n=1 Tax=Diabrotica undecimpunctata TaxID=50387 RepID=UPI003B638D7A
MSIKCQEIEECEARYDTFNTHKKLKEMISGNRNKPIGILTNADGTTITETQDKLRRWKEYIEHLFYDQKVKQLEIDGEITKPEIIKGVGIYAIKHTKGREALGPDNIPIKLLKIIDENNIDVLLDLFNSIYKTRNIPKNGFSQLL